MQCSGTRLYEQPIFQNKQGAIQSYPQGCALRYSDCTVAPAAWSPGLRTTLATSQRVLDSSEGTTVVHAEDTVAGTPEMLSTNSHY